MTRFGRTLLLIVAALALTLALAETATAQSTVSDDLVNEVSKGLYCPVCESEPLDTCGTQACIDWRAEIRAQLEAGMTKQQIYDDFVARYGERVLAQPSARGLNLVLWLGIPILLLVGGYLFFGYLRTLSPATEASSRTNANAPTRQKKREGEDEDYYLEQIERELEESS